MRIRLARWSLVALCLSVSLAGRSAALDVEPLKGKSLAFTVQDLSNPIWAQYAKTLNETAARYGMRATSLDCKANAATQITQVENFIQEGTDAMILHPAEANALESVAAQARAAGMKVISWDALMDNADVGYLIDNYAAGKKIGKAAAVWIDEKLGGTAKVAILEYPVYPELVARANGITDGLKEYAKGATIIAKASAINASEGMAKTETLLMANPDIKVICCIGDGGAIGANEAVKAAGLDADDFAIYSCDATDEALSKIANNEAIRMSVSWGTPEETVNELLTLTSKLLAGEPVDREFYRGSTPVDKTNLSEYYKQ